MTTASPGRRLAPDDRRDHILAAARTTLASTGMAGFSIEQVAREAGIASSLPRHYFGSRDGLLEAVARQIIEEVLAILGAPRGTTTLTERIDGYLQILRREPWVHRIWLHAAERPDELHDLVLASRRSLAELSFDVRWDDLEPREQLGLIGWASYFEGVISGWIELGVDDTRPVVQALADAARRLGVKGV